MATGKTHPTDADVQAFIDTVENPQRRDDCRRTVAIMQELTGVEPEMWGDAIIGFGRYTFTYDSGHSGEWFLTGLSPRKQALTLYIMSGFKRYDELVARLGKFKTGKVCLYIKKLDDVDLDVLRELITASITHLQEKAG